ncbi:hypothetical protein ACH4GE_15905 [Streptomyces tendae]|uniref:hypothetical protein n=1 Tax=Streptomyces tendae TaxID=1932 RepID=UPI0037A3F7FD
MSAPHPMAYEAFVARATADPAVVGLVLKGSHAHEGMATRHSDGTPRAARHVHGGLGVAEASRVAAARLDAYANAHYRSLKNARDGNPLAARLDAADSLGFLLELLFALDRRPCPYNKYREWELDRFPLPGWDTRRLLTVAGDVDVQRELFGRVEAVARAAGHAATLDAWGDDLGLMRPAAVRRVP